MSRVSLNINNKNFLDALAKISKEYSLEKSTISDFLKESFKYVFEREYSDSQIKLEIDIDACKIELWKELKIVTPDYFYGEGMEDAECLIPINKLPKIQQKKFALGDIFLKPINLEDLSTRIVKNILFHFQKLTLETMNQRIYEKWISRKGEVFEGMVEKIFETKEKLPREIIVSLIDPENEDNITKGVVFRPDLIQSLSNDGYRIYENLVPGQIYIFEIKDVLENSAGCPIILSRTGPAIVKYLMKKHISEVHDGLITINAISRISGNRSKVLVSTKNNNIDPVGCCIGPKGNRLKIISSQLLNERIDVILWNSDPIKNIVNAFTGTKILGYKVLEEEENSILLITTLENLLLAVGKRGINVKLVSLLTGWKICLKTIQEAKTERINYLPIDKNWDSKASDISGRIFKLHKSKFKEDLEEFDSENNKLNN